MLRNQQQEGLKTKNYYILLQAMIILSYHEPKEEEKLLLFTQLSTAAGLLIYQLIQIKVYY